MRASPARGHPCGCDHTVQHVGALLPPNPVPPTLLFNRFPGKKGVGTQEDPGTHLEMEVVLSLNILSMTMQDQS